MKEGFSVLYKINKIYTKNIPYTIIGTLILEGETEENVLIEAKKTFVNLDLIDEKYIRYLVNELNSFKPNKQCKHCNNTGLLKEPKNNEDFDYWYEKYDSMGMFSNNECYNKAIDRVGFIERPCPFCINNEV